MDGGNEPVCHRIRRPVSRISALTRETNDTGQSNTNYRNIYLTGYTNGSLGGANRIGVDAWVAKYSTRR